MFQTWKIKIGQNTRTVIWEDGAIRPQGDADMAAVTMLRKANAAVRGLWLGVPAGPMKKESYLSDPYVAPALVSEVFGNVETVDSDIPPLVEETA